MCVISVTARRLYVDPQKTVARKRPRYREQAQRLIPRLYMICMCLFSELLDQRYVGIRIFMKSSKLCVRSVFYVKKTDKSRLVKCRRFSRRSYTHTNDRSSLVVYVIGM